VLRRELRGVQRAEITAFFGAGAALLAMVAALLSLLWFHRSS
jgi:hypothetical protein